MNVNNVWWGPATIAHVLVPSAETTFAMNSSSRFIGTIFYAPKTGTLDRIGVPIRGITGNPPTYKVGFVQVDGSGITTTAYGGSAILSYDFTSASYTWVTLSTPASVTAGDLLAARVWADTSAPDASNYITVPSNIPCRADSQVPCNPYNAGSALTNRFFPLLGVRYNDDEIVLPSETSGTSESYDSADSPDEIGCLFQVPFTCGIKGFFIMVNPLLILSDFNANLYDASNNLLKQFVVDVSEAGSYTLPNGGYEFRFNTAINLTKDTDYRLTIAAAHGTNMVALAQATVVEAASRSYWPDGSRWQRTSRTNGGSWTEDPLKLPFMSLLLSDMTLSTGGFRKTLLGVGP